ncbi:YhcH/YjgK/YiaL family protein [Glaesserella sp.]|uniref:YhcH/YjgK/YiaL family protein n=1 Tax=Glaesserella sp. TaxID=2094731 RepID=UPI0035A13F66
MFFGHINNFNPNEYPKAIQFALDYLKNTDFDALQTGRYPLKGDLIYVQVLDLETKPKSDILPEVHRRYLDVQYLHSGLERMGVEPDLGQNPIAKEYDPERDIQHYAMMQNEVELIFRPGNFAVFFPEDIHRPACQDGGRSSPIRKVVVKIAISELEEK